MEEAEPYIQKTMPKSANLTEELLSECLATHMSTLISDWVVPPVAEQSVIASVTTAHSGVD